MAAHDVARRTEIGPKVSPRSSDEGLPPQTPRTPRTDLSVDRDSNLDNHLGAELERRFQVWMTRLDGRLNEWHSKHQQWLQCELPYVLAAVPQKQQRDRGLAGRIDDFSKIEDEFNNTGLAARRIDTESPRGASKFGIDSAMSPRRQTLATRLADINSALATRSRTVVELMQDGNCEFVVHHAWFDRFISVTILTNAIVLGVQIELDCHGTDMDENGLFFVLVEMSFALFFFVELVLRIATLGKRFFFYMWNWFDMVLVFLNLVDFVVILAAADDLKARKSDLWTTLVFFRVARVVRLLRFSCPLRDTVKTLLASLISFRWLLVAALLLTYATSAIITAGVLQQLTIGDVIYEDHQILQRYFGDLHTTAYTLYLSTMGGMTWKICVDGLWKVRPHLAVILVLFMFFTFFLVFNTFTGVVLERVIQNATVERDSSSIQENRATEDACFKLLEVLQASSEVDGKTVDSSTITLHELLKVAEDAQLSEILKTLKHETNSRKFFRLFSKGNHGEICARDFIDSCLHLKGGTRNADLHMILVEMEFENKRLHRQTRDDFQASIARLSRHMHASLKSLSHVASYLPTEKSGEFNDDMSNYVSPYTPRGRQSPRTSVPHDSHEIPWIRPASIQFLTAPRGAGCSTPGRSPRSARSS